MTGDLVAIDPCKYVSTSIFRCLLICSDFRAARRARNLDRLSATPKTVPTYDFANLSAYLWISNSNSMTPWSGSEWLLVRNTQWTFPVASSNCCDSVLPVQWSVVWFANRTELDRFGTANLVKIHSLRIAPMKDDTGGVRSLRHNS